MASDRVVKIPWKLILVPLAALVAYLSYAALALNRTIDALASGQTQNIEKFADLQAVRASLKKQINDEIARSNARLTKNGTDIGAMIGAGVLSAFETGIAGGIIDAIVTPEGVANLLAGKKDMKSPAEGDYLALWRNAHVESLDKVRFSREQGFDVTFRFDGLSWKLVDANVPFQNLLDRRNGGAGR